MMTHIDYTELMMLFLGLSRSLFKIENVAHCLFWRFDETIQELNIWLCNRCKCQSDLFTFTACYFDGKVQCYDDAY